MFRQPAFSGSWYQGQGSVLAEDIKGLIANAPNHWAAAPKVLIMPHAGHRFCGALAATAAAQLQAGTVKRVVIFGPSHRHRFTGVALPDAEGYSTPLGDMPVDKEWLAKAQVFHELVSIAEAHAQEHSLEVILPFIQQQLGNVPIVPLVVGSINPARLQQLMAHLWGDADTLIVISSDLSHFHDADTTQKMSQHIAIKIETANSQGLNGQDACGFQAMSALLNEAKRRGLRFTRLGITHSGHVNGDNNRVVGYGAWAGQELANAQLSAPLRAECLKAARQGLALRLKNGSAPSINVGSFSAPLRSMAAVFVTLNLHGKLRGCIGSLAAHQALIADVVSNAVKAGFNDSRFAPLTADELAEVTIEIALLSPSVAMSFSSEQDLLAQLTPGEDGLILTEGTHRGTFLPKVWDSLPTAAHFVNQLKRKAGLAEDYWSDTLRIARYSTERFAD